MSTTRLLTSVQLSAHSDWAAVWAQLRSKVGTSTAQHNHSRWFCWFILFVLPLLTGFGAPRVVDNIYTPTQRVRAGEGASWLTAHQGPTLAAAAYLLYDVDSAQLLLQQNAAEPLPPASLTKLMTALLVLEKGDLQAVVTIQGSDLVGGTSMGLQPGERRTVEELLWGLLVPSGNDAATALARFTGGSVAAFVTQMNERASQLGLTQTRFVNPHGLDAEGHLSSAADLLVLVQQNWDFPLFRQIVATPSTTVAGRTLRNTNQLLASYPGANGIKTGTTDAAGECLVAGIQHNGRQIIGIVLGSSDRYADMRALDAYYQATYQWLELPDEALTVLDRVADHTGKTWYLRTSGPAIGLLLRKLEHEQLQAYRRLQLPTPESWIPGLTAGTIEWRLGSRVVGTQLLVFW